jgi:hypothetical protein
MRPLREQAFESVRGSASVTGASVSFTLSDVSPRRVDELLDTAAGTSGDSRGSADVQKRLSDDLQRPNRVWFAKGRTLACTRGG